MKTRRWGRHRASDDDEVAAEETATHVQPRARGGADEAYTEEAKEDKENYLHKGLAQRSFTRSWTIAEDTEIRSVTFEDGFLTVNLGKLVPEHHARKDWL